MRIHQVDKMVRDDGLRLGARFGCADIHVPVDLGRIYAYDFYRQSLRDCQRDVAFPAGSGPHQKNCGCTA